MLEVDGIQVQTGTMNWTVGGAFVWKLKRNSRPCVTVNAVVDEGCSALS